VNACLLGAYRLAHRLSDPQRHVRGRVVVRDALVRTRTRYISIIRVLRLRSVPSIGPVTAAAFLAAIDDVQRFHHAHQLEAYLGLVPGERSSGETQRRGAITKAGHSRTRWLLIQAAVSILPRRPPQAEELGPWALRITARREKHVAVIALARRLAPASSMRCCAMTVCSSPSAFGLRVVPRRQPPPPSACDPRATRSWIDAGSGISQVRRVGERECRLGRRCKVAA
jgi:hypothetical protein